MQSDKSAKKQKKPLYNFSEVKYNEPIKTTRKEMNVMKKFIALTLALILCMSCFAACGETEEKTVVVGYTIYEPMNYKDADGKLIGFDTELAEAVFAKLGYKVLFQEIDWDAKYTDLNAGSIDCVWNGFTANTADTDGVARADKVDFSYNYMKNQQVVVVKKDSGIKTAEDLKGKMGAAEAGSAGESYAKDNFKDSAIKGFGVQTECLKEVLAGTQDFAILDEQLAKSYCGKGDYADLEVVEGLSSEPEFYAIGFKKGSALTAEVNKALEELAADGTIAKLAEKYGLSNPVITDFADQKK